MPLPTNLGDFMAKKPIKLIAMSDTHCGHELGLTPPAWENNKPSAKKQMRAAMWKWFKKTAGGMNPDIMIFNGDAIDGKGQASGGSEQLYMEWQDQVDMAEDVIKVVNPAAIYMSYGTAYHTGKDTDWERVLADQLSAKSIGGEDDLDVRGTVINYKHHLGRSGVPHGRTAAILRDALWNEIWAGRGEYPRAGILLRSHVHYHVFAGQPGLLALTLPSLQGYGTKYGGRRMTGTVDIGFVEFDFYGPNDYNWTTHIWRAPMKPVTKA